MNAERHSAAAFTPASLARSMTLVAERLGQYGLPVLLAAVIIGFSIARPNTFGIWSNFSVTLEQQIPVLIIALGLMVTLTVGEFDLSVAGNASLANTFVVGLCVKQHWPVGAAIVVAIAISTAIGLINGLVITRLRIPAFVATLAMGTIVGGIGLAYTAEQDLFNAPGSLTKLGRTEIFGGLPITVIYGLFVAAVMLLVLRWLPLGRRMRAVGENRRAAELTGIPSRRYIAGCFATGGLLAGIAGAILGAQTGGSAVSSSGALLLPGFAAAFLGATTIESGRFNVVGTVIAVYFLAFAVDGLELVGAEGWVQPVIDGLALLIAVGLSAWALQLRSARQRREQLLAIESASLSQQDDAPPSARAISGVAAADR